MNATGQGATGRDETTVLLAEDEEMTLEAYRLWLQDDYRIRTAAGGTAALEAMDEEVDVVLLDRRMPETSGDEALERIHEAGYDCKVAMVTAVDPDLDLVDPPFDAYLTKPVDREDLVGVIDRLDRVATQDDVVQELFAVAQKRTTLERGADPGRLGSSGEYRALVGRCEELLAAADAAVEGIGSETFETILRDLEGGAGGRAG